MPSGKTHDRIAWYLSIPLTYLTWYLSDDIVISIIFFVSFIFSSLMFSGDLDLVSIQTKRWGNLRWIWIPYRKLISHRSVLSHGIIIATLFRLVYIFVFSIIIYTIFYLITQNYFPDLNKDLTNTTRVSVKFLKSQPKEYFLSILLGLIFGDIIHTSSDILVSKIKRFIRRKKRKKNK
ncbi:MAG: hypothetical protein KatS3mg068_2082 [Candidatus Sericytochromatia bacterium]|nr:MAG: hypothetical protein KatS3mg068_2082 [Candidatus Sericytochromatia bacterium]